MLKLSYFGFSGAAPCAEWDQISTSRVNRGWKEKKRNSWLSPPSKNAGVCVYGGVCVSVLQLLEQHYLPDLVSIVAQMLLLLALDYRGEYCSFFAESGLCPFQEDCRFTTARTHQARLQVRRVQDVCDVLNNISWWCWWCSFSCLKFYFVSTTASKRGPPG